MVEVGASDVDINIPEINSGVSVEQKNAEIAVTKQGAFYINGRPISSDNLVKELTDLKPTLEKAEVAFMKGNFKLSLENSIF